MTSLSETSLLAGSSGVTSGYTIDQSIRFNDNDSPYLYKAYSGAGSKQTFTCSFWMKVGNVTSARRGLISFVQDVPLELYSADNLRVFLFGSERLVTRRKLRDVAAWYHIVLRVDSTETVSNNRIRLYINGERETDFSAESYPSQNANGNMWGSNLLQFGRTYGSSYYFDGYLAEIHYADGYSYGPENFGEFKNNTDIWIPKEFEGSYGTNGVYLKGEDSSAFGNDSSGNNNDFGNVFGLAAHDQVADSPTNNFAVINAVYSTRTTSGAGSSHTLENGNLFQQADSYSSSNYGTRPFTVQPLNRGKWYFEFEGNTEAGGGNLVHVAISEESAFYVAQGTQSTNRYGLYLESGSAMYVLYPGASRQETNAPIAQYTKIIGCATDFDNAKMYFFVDGTEIHGQDISAGTAASNLSGWSTSSNWIFHFATVTASNNSARSNIIFNFGQEGTFAGTQTAGGNSDGNGIGNFKHSVPSGYLALCTSNLGS